MFARAAWTALLKRLERDPSAPQFCPAGRSQPGHTAELLVTQEGHSAQSVPPRRVVVIAATRPGELAARLRSLGLEQLGADVAAALAVGVGAAAGRVAGLALGPHGASPLSSVRILMKGLPEIPLAASPGIVPWSLPATEAERAVWSRSLGALGERAWRRLASLHVVQIGCGRTGSLMAASLARIGIRNLTLVDPDRLEAHNLGEMDLMRPQQIGDFKVYAAAEELERMAYRLGCDAGSRLSVAPLAEPVSSLKALEAAKRADVLISCVDNETARAAVAVLARLYLKPLLDVGTAVLEESGRRHMGADIRLVMPDECLLCVGGLNEPGVAMSRLIAAPEETSGLDWRRHRAGSLRSLNTVAVGLGLRLLEELAAGRRGTSAWVRVEFEANGLPYLEVRDSRRREQCPLCRYGGWGDDGISRCVPELVGATAWEQTDGRAKDEFDDTGGTPI
ncbi:MAG: hypothetical protein KatS3mg004_0186 [Bryobacteraceae bacterium]|nr:MAG: hypothetical protein KatS3mg004_0186 [Bryobacteraceae bacterium]